MTLYANIGIITLLKGEATIKRNAKVFDAKAGTDIESGDKIDTYAKSKMQIIFNDETIITLGANTEYIVDSYDDKKDPHMEMRLKSGFLKTITGKIGKIAPSRFKLKIKSATIGIRGTGWKTYVGANIENILCFKGAIIVKTVKKEISLSAGNMLLITDGMPKVYKANPKFFNSQVERIESKLKPKKKLILSPTKKSKKEIFQGKEINQKIEIKREKKLLIINQ